jgi:eukaryotic-like serine/threonine-protein kinase
MEDDSAIGRLVLDRYRIVRRIAKGGMGTIYLARNEGAAGFVRPVVVKRILPGSLDEETAVRLFQREARIMAHLRHPNVVGVIDFAQDDAGYTMVLEYVHGFHLARWCYYVRKTQGRFPVEPAVHIVISVLDALHHAHTLTGPDGMPLQIVHRDVKPANVLIDIDGHVKLTDFGIAQMTTDKTISNGDKSAVRGTFPYMPPELFDAGKPGPASDTYACAVVLHEVLAGRNEFRVKDLSLTVARVMQHVPTPLDALRADVSPELAAVVARALAKDPAKRFADAQSLAEALRAARGVGGEEAQRQLAARARADFRAPRFAAMLKAEELDVLDRAWREEPPAGPAPRSPAPQTAPPPAPPSSDELVRPPSPTVALDAGSSPSAPRGARQTVQLWLGVVAVLVAAAAAGIAWYRSGDDAPAQYIFVSGDVAPDDGEALQPTPAPAPAARDDEPAPPDAGAAPGRHDAAPRPTDDDEPVSQPRRQAAPSEPEALTRAFRRQQPAIRRCFDAHAAEAVGAPELSVRFRVAASGEILSAELAPVEAMQTELGACLIEVARRTEFGPQRETLQFRIPIAIRSR